MLSRRVLAFVLGAVLAVMVCPLCVVAQAPREAVCPMRAPASEELLDLNTASPSQLAALPGMGGAYAKRVVEGRPYSSKNQLVTRGVLPRETYECMKDRVVAHRPQKTKVDAVEK